MFLRFYFHAASILGKERGEQKELEVHKGRPEIKHNWMSVEVGGR